MDRRIFIAIIAGLVVFTVWTFRHGADSCLLIDDNLDGPAAQYRVMRISGTVFAGLHAVVPNFMNGVPRNSLPGELQFSTLLFAALGMLPAFFIQSLLQRLTAFAGMFLLLRLHIVRGALRIAEFGPAACFALLPFFPCPSFCLAVAGQPLLVSSYLSLRSGDTRLRHWLVIALFPFFSWFAFAGFIVAATLGVLLVVDVFCARALLRRDAAVLLLFLAATVVAEYRLFYQHLFARDYVSHRSEFQTPLVTTRDAVRGTVDLLLFGQTDARALPLAAGPIVLAAAILGLRKRTGQWWVTAAAVAVGPWIALAFGFAHHPSVVHFVATRIPPLRQFQWDRVYFVYPALMYAAFGGAIVILWRELARPRFIVTFALVIQALFLVMNDWTVVEQRRTGITFRRFYAERLFARVRDSIGRPQREYRVVSLGIHPVVAQFNGFYTLDGYCVDYPLSYKHRFREVIAAELARSEIARQQFDSWGSQCYLHAAEVPGTQCVTSTPPIHDLRLNTAALKRMGGDYLFSAVRIDNAAREGLSLKGVFQDAQSAWTIYVYSIEGAA